MIFSTALDLITLVLWVVFGVVKAWAFIDCLRRPAAAFPAVGRLAKWVWLLLTGAAALTGLVPGLTIGLFGIAGLISALVYLVDVRPRIAEITGGR